MVWGGYGSFKVSANCAFEFLLAFHVSILNRFWDIHWSKIADFHLPHPRWG